VKCELSKVEAPLPELVEFNRERLKSEAEKGGSER
jgi:hypothetical protein